MSGQWVLDFEIPDRWISANGREHHMVRAPRTALWRATAARHARDVPTLERVHLTVEPRWTDKRRRDALNYAPTFKAVIDGIVDAGVIADDNDNIVTGVEVRNGPPATGVARLRITITEVVA